MKGWSFDGLVKAIKSGAFIEGAKYSKVSEPEIGFGTVDVIELPLVGGSQTLVVEIRKFKTPFTLILSNITGNPEGLDCGVEFTPLNSTKTTWLFMSTSPLDSGITYVEGSSCEFLEEVGRVKARFGGSTNRTLSDIQTLGKTMTASVLILGLRTDG